MVQDECTSRHQVVHLTIVKMVHFIKWTFYHTLKKIFNETCPAASKMDVQPRPVFGAEAAPEWACFTPAPPPPTFAVSTWDLWAQSLNLASFCGPQPGLSTLGSH